MRYTIICIILSAVTILSAGVYLCFRRNEIGITIYGIDVSHHQGNIDWKKVAADRNLQFVYIKATEGSTYVDPMFKKNITEAREAGLKVGAYHFMSTTSSIEKQFDNFKKHCRFESMDIIPVLDFEKINGKTTKQLQEMLAGFSSLCEKEFGTRPIIYTSTALYNNIVYSDNDLRRHKIFIGHPHHVKPSLKGNPKKYIWQYSDRGKVAGIKSSVDQNKLVGLSLSDILLSK